MVGVSYWVFITDMVLKPCWKKQLDGEDWDCGLGNDMNGGILPWCRKEGDVVTSGLELGRGQPSIVKPCLAASFRICFWFSPVP
jgi:hypothetical protein